MREPNSIEINHLHKFIGSIFHEFDLGESFVGDFFAFEQRKLDAGAKVLVSFLDDLAHFQKPVPPLTLKYMLLGLITCVYLRLYDTGRFKLYLSMWNVMRSICKTISKFKIQFETDNEGMVLANTMTVLVQKAKHFWELYSDINPSSIDSGSRQILKTNLEAQDSLSPAALESVFEMPLKQVKGKFKLVRLHLQIVDGVSNNGFSKDLLSKLFVYRLLLKNTTFIKDDSKDIFPRYSVTHLVELIILEHLISDVESTEIFHFFWTNLGDKIKYFLNFYEFVKGDHEGNIQFISNYVQSLKNLKSIEQQDMSFERETLRLRVINSFFQSNPQVFQPSISASPPAVSSRPLYIQVFKKVLKEAMEKLFGLNFERFVKEEKINQNMVPSQTQENLEKEMGNSMLSRSILGDESILGSVMNMDFNVNSKSESKQSRVK